MELTDTGNEEGCTEDLTALGPGWQVSALSDMLPCMGILLGNNTYTCVMLPVVNN